MADIKNIKWEQTNKGRFYISSPFPYLVQCAVGSKVVCQSGDSQVERKRRCGKEKKNKGREHDGEDRTENM